MIKGLEMDYVASIPITGRAAETISPSYFNDPYFVAKKAIVIDPRSPQFEKKNVFGHFKIQTVKEQELSSQMMPNRRYSTYSSHYENEGTTYNTPRKDNKYYQSLINPTNEMFETKLKEKPKGAKGSSIMSGEINKINKLVLKTFDKEKVPYAGSSIDISQPDIYRYEVKNHWSRNNPIVQSMSYRRPNENSGFSPRAPNDLNQTFEKSKFATIPKKINSMENILDWKPKELQRLHMINDSKRLMMEKSLGNTIPYKQKDIDLEHKPYAAGNHSKVSQYHQKYLPIIAPTKEFKLPNLSLSKLSY